MDQADRSQLREAEPGLGLRIQGLGFWVSGLGFRVEG